ncbi:MAG: NAD(P)H-quinone oxidoreductase [Rhodospirillales bacterium]|nr:NAD(P)H-quinone oxidoreductase [Rhodospirillales bacterium]
MPLPATMTCIEIPQPGGPEMLKPAIRPLPTAAPSEVLIRVEAAGVNRPDCIQRMGNYAPPPGTTDIPGLEVSGEIVQIGNQVTDWAVGDKVAALVAGGGYAQYVAAPALQCLPIPAGLSMLEAAALPETCFTVWSNVFERGALQPGETLLVHGGSSGIGTTAIQIASQRGARVMATAGNAEKCQACLDLGAERAVNYRDEDFVEAAREFGGGKGVDVILDMVGGDYIARNIKSLAADGRLVQIAFLQGAKAEVNFMPVMLKRLTITGATLRPQSIARKGEIAAALKQQVWPLIAAGKVKPVIFRTFPLEQAADAHTLMESSQHIGKIMLKT